MSGNSIRDTFFEECEELLEALIEGLSEMEESPGDLEIVNAVFRAVHSIKGGAGAFGLDRLVNFAHTFETVLDMVRSGELAVDATLISIFHRSGDHLSDLVAAERDDKATDDDTESALIRELETYKGADPEETEFVFEAMALDLGDEVPGAGPMVQVETTYTIHFKPHRALYENGHEPLLLLDGLAELGDLEVEADLSEIPTFDNFDPSEPFLSWNAKLTTEHSKSSISAVFEFVEGLCALDISEANATPDTRPQNAKDEESGATAVPQATMPPDEQRAPSPVESTDMEGDRAASAEKTKLGPKPTLRVDLDRVDRLINTVGELIINQAMISQRIEELDLPTVAHLTNELEAYKLLARDIQEGVMAIRAQPVKPLFQRMSRIVREASDATGKKARLITVGDSTEVDKTVIERLADPLTHMIRNAVDHGLEKSDQRVAAGKDATGIIRLSAAHRSGSVFIEISDDGAGLNREVIHRKAIEKGLIDKDFELSEPEIDNLLFLPGFSTAGQVSSLSGRGVGMDVVKNAVSALGGRISISSQPGKGSTFTIILPLTLAVMDGFVISVSTETMVIPISSILETIRPKPTEIQQIGKDKHVVCVRGSYVPIIDVQALLGLAQDSNDKVGILLLVSTETDGLVALKISEIHDQRQVVIKSLESNYAAIEGVSAATILGDGKIALILDPDQLIALSKSSTSDVMLGHLSAEANNGPT